MNPPRFDPTAPPQLITRIIAAVAKHHDLSAKQILSPDRSGHLIWPRHLCMWLAVKLSPKRSQAVIGRAFKRDHGTISYALNSTQDFMGLYPKAKAEADHWLKHFSGNSQP